MCWLCDTAVWLKSTMSISCFSCLIGFKSCISWCRVEISSFVKSKSDFPIKYQSIHRSPLLLHKPHSELFLLPSKLRLKHKELN